MHEEFTDFMIDEEGNVKVYEPIENNIERMNRGRFLIGMNQPVLEDEMYHVEILATLDADYGKGFSVPELLMKDRF